MTSPKYNHHFSLQNLPFGIASSPSHPSPQSATRLHDTVIFLHDLQQANLFSEIADLPANIFIEPTLNNYAALPKTLHQTVRQTLQAILQLGISVLPRNSTESIDQVQMHLPVTIPGFTDFSCSLAHVQNAGRAILNDPTPPPGFFHFPIGYTGRASTIVVSGTPITRPLGHFYDRSTPEKHVIYGPSRAMDYELEIGVVIGTPVPAGAGVDAQNAEEHIFGLVVLNDWSARDIQGCEMVPLGPLNGKAFGTTISPWIITTEALAPFKVPGPEPRVPLPPHLQDPGEFNYAIDMTVGLKSESGGAETVLCRSQAQEMFWSARQMCAHLASTGCDLRTGEILGTGTDVSYWTTES
ncbi:hypothetical protein FE257_004023 [Aspergillus nanangensis]|uniref:Fumarylacetoacetase n=1 Tax=Aspergillus nanangensis TaxID=2582783 RepID=A0AAD4CRV7_ASPNN|nr:hypothetical protein FE257_004023 [Aspergillus nanangensis]